MNLNMAFTRIVSMIAILFLFLLSADVTRVISAPQEQTIGFSKGDVLVALSGGKIEWHNPDGNLFKTLDTTTGGNTAGLAFNSYDQNLYVTNYNQSNTIILLDSTGNFLRQFGDVYKAVPVSISFDSSKNVYVGFASSPRLIKLDVNGDFVAGFDIKTDQDGDIWIDLASDQCTMYYTSNGRSIKRFDVCKNEQLPDFTTGLPSTAYALRLLPGGGLMVADSQEILRLDVNGKIINTYAEGKYHWYTINLDPDGISFWSTDLNSNEVFKFDIASGKQTVAFQVSPNLRVGGVGGLAVIGEITDAQSTRTPRLPPPTTLTPSPRLPPPTTLTPSPTLPPPTTPTLLPTQPPAPTPTLLPTQPPAPTPTLFIPPPPSPTPPSNWPLVYLLVGGLVGGGLLVILGVIFVTLITDVRRPARPSTNRSDSKNAQTDKVKPAESPVKVRSRSGPVQQIIESSSQQSNPLIRFRLGQGEVIYFIETES